MSGRMKKSRSELGDENFSSGSDSENDINDDVHNRFLEDIRLVHAKPKIPPATRCETAAEVSEFNLQSKRKSDKGKPFFRKDDLLRPLRSKQPKLAQKLEVVKKTSALPKPLESVYEQKVQRVVGFEKAKKQLDRWDDVVQSNRVADQLHFPLKSRKIEVYDHSGDDLFSSFSNPTPLEKELAAVLNSSDVAKEDKEKMEQSKFRTALKDIIEKRKMIASVRARASYAVSKARRQNKIKSKKYHRLLRSEKTKQQIKDFEALQKTDPQAALKQLEMLEKSRAQERATLRHRNTGKWARNQVIKAKYNKDSRIALSEQLSKNRELTQKLKVKDSDEDSGDESDMRADSGPIIADPNNPWVPDGNDYGQFVSQYKKYWEEKTQEAGSSRSTANELMINTKLKPEEEKKEKTTSGTSENKDDCDQNIVVDVTVQTKASETSAKVKSKKRKSAPAEVAAEVEPFDDDEKCSLVKEITNSSGCWTVTELSEGEINSKNIKSKRSRKKPSESGIGSSVCEMFKSLEDKISRNLKRKFSEVVKTESSANVESEETAKKKKNKKKKAKKNGGKNDAEKVQLLDQSTDTNNDPDNEKKLSTVLPSQNLSYADVDANKFTAVSTKRLATETPDTVTIGGENIDDDENDNNVYREMVEEAFATDDVVVNFENEKAQAVEDSKPKVIDSSLPGWGSWTRSSSLKGPIETKVSKAKRPRINKRLLFKIPKAPPRKDANKGHVIINEDKSNKMKEHLVSDLPYPFNKVKDFEATIRAPVGRTWVPETAHKQLVAPPVGTKLGTVIEPMDEGELIDRGEI